MKSRKPLIIIGIVLAVSLICVFTGRNMLTENPFDTVRVFEEPSRVVVCDDEMVLIADMSKTRVNVLTGYSVTATIEGRRETNGFFYVEHMASLGDKIYIADVKYEEGSTLVTAEHISRFSKNGQFEKVVYERIYDDEKPYQYGNIMDMTVHENVLYILVKNSDTLELYFFKDDESFSQIRAVSTLSAPYICNAVYDASSNTILLVSKDGIIYAEDFLEGFTELVDYSDSGIIPWAVTSDSAGRLYITDLASQSIISDYQDAIIFTADGVIFRLNSNEDDVISFADGEIIYLIQNTGEVIFASDEVNYGSAYFVARLLVWIAAIFAGIIAVAAVVRICIWLLKTGNNDQTKYLIIIILATALTAVIVSISVFTMSIQTEAQEKEFSITQLSLAVSGSSGEVFGADFETLNSLDDYGNPAYQRVRAALDPICDMAYENGGYLYYVLYKDNEDIEGIVCAVIDYENTVGVIHPVAPFPDEWKDVFEGRLPYIFESYTDVNGSWAYAITPVYNENGDIIGLLEMGYNLDGAYLRTQRQIREIVLSTAVLLIIFLLLFTEITAIIEPVTQLRVIKNTLVFDGGKKESYVPELIRALMFLAFFADNLYTAFIPQLSGRIFETSAIAMSLSMGAALPLSVKLFCIAVASVAGGVMIERIGMKVSLIFGVLAQMAGYAVTAAAVSMNNYILLLCGLAVAGLGLGVVLVSGNTLPTGYSDEDKRNNLFTGVNVGMISGIVVGASVGAYIAQYFGYPFTFVIAAAVLLPAIWLSVKSSPGKHEMSFKTAGYEDVSDAAETERLSEGRKISVVRFLLNRSVFSFLLFAMSPFMILMAFREFTYPLFAAESEITEVAIGQTLLFSGTIAIFIAPALIAPLLKYLRPKWVNVLAGAICAAGVLLFAYMPTVQNAVAAVYLLSFAGGIGYTAQSVYYSTIRSVKVFGGGKSMGIFGVFNNLAETAGPLLFGAVLILGYSEAAFILGVASVALLILFVLFGESYKNDEEK